MSECQLVLTKYRRREFGTVVIKSVDKGLAARLPDLRIPRMPDEARAAFRTILAYEVPPANGSLVDFLQLAENRGYSAHPCDWIPDYDWKHAGRHPELYQPWVDWLSETGFTKFHSGNSITSENFARFSPGQRDQPIRDLIESGRDNNFYEIKKIAEANPGSVRAALAKSIRAWGMFNGCYPWQVPLLRYFLGDKSEKVSTIARERLDKMGPLTTEIACARVLAGHITVEPDVVRWSVPQGELSYPFIKEFACTSFAAVAEALDLSPIELAHRVNLDGLGKSLMHIASKSADIDARIIMATRWLDQATDGETCPFSSLDDAPISLWKSGLHAMLWSHYWNSVEDYLGAKSGTLDYPEFVDWLAYEAMPASITNELEGGKLPINTAYDPLRVLGKIVSKAAARQLLDDALALGMKPDNPRLTMLKFNLAL